MSFVLAVTSLCLAGCGEGPTAAQAAKEAKHAVKDLSKVPSAVKPDVKAKPEEDDLLSDPTKVALPWTFEQVRANMELGTVLVYDRSGKDAKGKKVDDEFRWIVRRAADDEVGTSGTVIGGGDDQPSGEIAMAKWTKFSPFFAVENVEHELEARETLTVPAGEFDCIVADLKGFFGNRKKVWMVIDKPGVYAKVVELPNEAEEKDKTDLTWELKEITKVEPG
jgi:hypothetical protein